MKLLLWNVNGLRAISKKLVDTNTSFDEFILRYDIVVFNETKIGADKMLSNSNLIPTEFQAYHSHSTVKDGYSGVSILSREKPKRRIDPTMDDQEGRLVILEFSSFILIGVYVPNSGSIDKNTNKPKRLQFRTETWDKDFRDQCIKLEKQKPLVVLGDLNVARTDMDVYAPNRLHRSAGFTPDERKNFELLIETTSLVDVWRQKHPYTVQYSFFDYRSKARYRNAGWRIDYALVSKMLCSSVIDCKILSEVVGSDHLPLELSIKKK